MPVSLLFGGLPQSTLFFSPKAWISSTSNPNPFFSLLVVKVRVFFNKKCAKKKDMNRNCDSLGSPPTPDEVVTTRILTSLVENPQLNLYLPLESCVGGRSHWKSFNWWEALRLFRAHVEGKGSSSLAALVATDVAARGLDIPNISCHLGFDKDDPLGSADVSWWEKGMSRKVV